MIWITAKAYFHLVIFVNENGYQNKSTELRLEQYIM